MPSFALCFIEGGGVVAEGGAVDMVQMTSRRTW